MNDVMSRAFFLNAFPRPDFVPKMFDVVRHIQFGRTVLVITLPKDPEHVDINEMGDITTRPCVCDILLGEETVKDVDVTCLQALSQP